MRYPIIALTLLPWKYPLYTLTPLFAPSCGHFLLRDPQGTPFVSLTSSCKLRSKLRPSREEAVPGNPSLVLWKTLDGHQRFSVSLLSLGLVGDTPSAHQPRQVCAVALSDRGPNGL